MKKTILFLTGNKEKIIAARLALEGTGFDLTAKKVDIPEIQADDVCEVAKAFAKSASDILKKAVVKIDTGLFIEALNGFPGVYSAYVEKRLKAKDILGLMEGVKNRKAYYKDALAYCEYGKEPVVFEAYTYGSISEKEDGKFGIGFDTIFIVDGDPKTMANYDDEERIQKFDTEVWKKLVEYLKSDMRKK
ncbi:non-canonical purine NTP pyrophosphatase [Candidatus Woesearchaeota archaeon]|nr:non-canonical purine NTP pyrophosphatase [Candidatus Woesearchaeota archaeon]